MPKLKIDLENEAPLRLYYEDHGAGDPIILIHGWPLSSASWEKQVPALLKAGYRVITYDRRGFGMSGRPTSGYDADTLARDLNALIVHLGLENVTLVGFSMGGVEVARFLGLFGTDRVKKVALVSAVTPYLVETLDNPEGVDVDVFEDIKKNILEDRPAFLTEFFKKFYNAGLFKGTKVSDEVLHLSWIIGAFASPIATHDVVDAWLQDFREDLKSAGIPILVVHGDSDQTVPFEHSAKRIPGLVPGAKLVVIEGAPHGLNWTHASRLNQELLDFLGAAKLGELKKTG